MGDIDPAMQRVLLPRLNFANMLVEQKGHGTNVTSLKFSEEELKKEICQSSRCTNVLVKGKVESWKLLLICMVIVYLSERFSLVFRVTRGCLVKLVMQN